MSFEPYNLDARIAAGIRAAGYVNPTAIQQGALPPALGGRDVLGLAQTGTGKTAGFVLPILQRLLNGPRGKTRALIVAPTRELAEQIHGEVTTLGRKTGLRSVTVYGGVGFTPQQIALRRGTDIVVACPGRFLDHVGRGNVDLSALEVLILDEADHLLDMGFLPDIKRILSLVPDDAQRMLFSATMPSDLRGLVDDVLDDPVTVEVGRREPAQTVEQALYPVLGTEKTDLLKHVLKEHDPRSVLVFTRTKHRAKRLADQLERENHFAAAIQGNLSQNKRQKALDGFRDGTYHILVATDIAARGIDVSRVSHVVNYDMPDTVEAYIHRIGRTGRMERSGQALTFVTPEDGAMVRAIEQRLGRKIARVRVEGFTPVAAAASAPTTPQRNGRSNGSSNGRSNGGRSNGGRSNGGRPNGPSSGARTGGRAGGKPVGKPAGASVPQDSAPAQDDGAGGGSRRRRRRGRRSRGSGSNGTTSAGSGSGSNRD